MRYDRGNFPKFVVVILLIMGAFGVMGGGLVAPGLPTIGAAFDAHPEHIGLILSVYTLAAAISLPVIGYYIDTLGASIHWKLVFAVYGLSIGLAVLLYLFLPETGNAPDRRKRGKGSAREYASSLLYTLKIKKVRNIMIHSMILFFFLYALVTYLPLYLIQIHGFDEIFSGIALAGQAFFSAILAAKASSIATYLNWRRRASLGFASISICFLTLPYWPTGSYMVSLSFILYGIGMGIVSPTIYDRVTRLAPPDLTGSVVAVFNTMKYVGMTLAPVLIGLSLIFIGLNVVFICIGIMGALWALVTLLPDLR